MNTTYLWTQIHALKGLTIRTKYGKPFEVVSVDDRYATVKPLATGKLRRVRRQEFEQAAALGLSQE